MVILTRASLTRPAEGEGGFRNITRRVEGSGTFLVSRAHARISFRVLHISRPKRYLSPPPLSLSLPPFFPFFFFSVSRARWPTYVELRSREFRHGSADFRRDEIDKKTFRLSNATPFTQSADPIKEYIVLEMAEWLPVARIRDIRRNINLDRSTIKVDIRVFIYARGTNSFFFF